MMLGFDSRYHDGTRPPAALGFRFFGGKVSDASWKPDDPRHVLLEHQRRACRQQRIPFLPFHYWRQANPVNYQVDMFAAKLDAPELPPALDFEDPWAKAGCGAAVLAFVREAVATLGGKPLVYTRKSWWDKWVNAEQAAEIASLTDLWVAHYTTAPEPLLPRGWTDWTVWQYAGDVKVPGMSGGVDFDRAKDEWYGRYIA